MRLTVFKDGQYLERVTLLALSQLQQDKQTGELDYVPASGWEVGEYDFRAELLQDGASIQQTPLQHVTVTAESITSAVSWKTLGVLIGSILTAGLVLIGIMLYLRRNMLRDYWK
jgi:hypothetical protein